MSQITDPIMLRLEARANAALEKGCIHIGADGNVLETAQQIVQAILNGEQIRVLKNDDLLYGMSLPSNVPMLLPDGKLWVPFRYSFY